jgi:hypothetical protein
MASRLEGALQPTQLENQVRNVVTCVPPLQTVHLNGIFVIELTRVTGAALSVLNAGILVSSVVPGQSQTVEQPRFQIEIQAIGEGVYQMDLTPSGAQRINEDLLPICDYNRSVETLFYSISLALFVLAILTFVLVIRETFPLLNSEDQISIRSYSTGPERFNAWRKRDRAIKRAWNENARSRKRLLFAAFLIAAAVSGLPALVRLWLTVRLDEWMPGPGTRCPTPQRLPGTGDKQVMNQRPVRESPSRLNDPSYLSADASDFGTSCISTSKSRSPVGPTFSISYNPHRFRKA